MIIYHWKWFLRRQASRIVEFLGGTATFPAELDGYITIIEGVGRGHKRRIIGISSTTYTVKGSWGTGWYDAKYSLDNRTK